MDESLEQLYSLEDRNVRAYDSRIWRNGGYPFPIEHGNKNDNGYLTIIGKKCEE